MWDIDAVNLFKDSFPDDKVGSRIILTSCRHDVAPHNLMVNQMPHSLRPLNQEESLELLQSKLSSGVSLDLGVKIVEKCKGLPLMIVIVCGVLKATDPKDWKLIFDGLRSMSNTDLNCRNTLELSYQHLPEHLRRCLLYFAAFPEDEEVSVRKLVRLWIVEGFVPNDAAESCLRDLIDRSLLMIAKHRSDGGVKTCRIHDLLHDFCTQKANVEQFFHFLKGYEELLAFNEPLQLQRLCIHSEVEHFKKSKLFCLRTRSLIINSSKSQPRRVSTQLHSWIDISSAIGDFRLLTVLDLEQVDLGRSFPSQIERFLQLTFLAIRCDNHNIPSSIGNLSNLETLIIQYKDMHHTSLPVSVWNLQKLQCLYIKVHFLARSNQGGGLLPQSSSTLPDMERLSGVIIRHFNLDGILRKFPSIRKLKFILQDVDNDRENMVVPDILGRLDSLHVLYDNRRMGSRVIKFVEYSLPVHLKKLTLGKFRLSWRNLSTIIELPNLEVLKLLWTELEEETWEMKEGEFPKLKILKMLGLKLLRWFSDSDDQLGCFQKLVLENCYKLQEMPLVSKAFQH